MRMSFPHCRTTMWRWVLASAVVSLSAGAAAVGCSGDDTAASNNGDDASLADGNELVDVQINVIDSGKPIDAGHGDASDAAVLCSSAPDAAIYGLDAIDAGSMQVTSSGCKGCHTADLSGNATTPLSGEYPKNLTPDRATGLGCWTDDEIARAILVGIDDDGNQLCVMPRFAASIGDAGVTNVIAFLRSLPAVSKDVPGTMCPTDAGIDAD